MAHEFDPGYDRPSFASLVRDYPGSDVFPPADFRVEWGPIFHRGRLDGTARVLVVGQDPGAHETFARRILVGEAGQRVQGFLAKLGIDRSYVMINAFLYSVYGQSGGERHKHDPAIIAYRNRWIDAVAGAGKIEAIVAFGTLADEAYQAWRATGSGKSSTVPYEHVPHPTYPDSSSGGVKAKFDTAMASMLKAWNDALARLAQAIDHPDAQRPLVPYGSTLLPEDHSVIPEQDLPAGLPAWMGGLDSWSDRQGATTDLKRATLVVTVPTADRTWMSPA
jgi:hypothetical protein